MLTPNQQYVVHTTVLGSIILVQGHIVTALERWTDRAWVFKHDTDYVLLGPHRVTTLEEWARRSMVS